MAITKLTDTTFSKTETVTTEFYLDILLDEISWIDNQITSLNNQITRLQELKAKKQELVAEARNEWVITKSERQALQPKEEIIKEDLTK